MSPLALQLPAGALGDRGDEPAVNLQRNARDVGSGGREQESRDPAKLGRFAVAAQGYAYANLTALLLDRDARVSGPRLVTPDEVGELEVSTVLNGEVRRKNVVSNMIFSPWSLVSFHSKVMALLAGDVI